MISFHSKGDFSNSHKYFNKLIKYSDKVNLNAYGERGVIALRNASPQDTKLMSSSWGYDVKKSRNSITITWKNTDIEGGCNVAILVQYGHATRGGTYVKGVDFINPAMTPIFEEIANDLWKEVSRL